MARFDVYAGVGDGSLLLDCQSDLLNRLNTRFVVPLQPPGRAPIPARRLNPEFDIDGARYVMVTQYAAVLQLRDCGPVVGSLAQHDVAILNALDMLISGY
ncbi:plasmid maintenance protein CcdB [Sandarakinorhabdus cyanobacteriorum]|uniref:Toxin CcdB n=1 Tax=Sandarakinorhabdus cyanobacteriorum TaxID=1981098 RepID=A0A255Y628_9SPHN|nr:CcdB family protein [Sandarakinorhabdus cyanobacteriorum]OYQ24668.1 plasmid maintenance protein CcdB [Sandarakinorhabdus cyanobacteriorum]